MELYIDIFIIENTILNIFVLFLTSRLMGIRGYVGRKVAASVIGTFFATAIVLLSPELFQSWLVKLIVSGIISYIAFLPKSIQEYIKVFLSLLLCANVVAGTMFFIITQSTGNFVFFDGILFVTPGLKPWVLIFTFVFCTLFVKLLYKFKKMQELREKLLVPLSIIIENKNIQIPALVDTGNLLCDPISKTPVIVTEYFALRQILPDEVTCLLDTKSGSDNFEILEKLQNSDWSRRLRIIPFSSLGNEHDLLLGIRPDSVEIGNRKLHAKDVIVGIYKKSLSSNKEFQALLGPQLI